MRTIGGLLALSTASVPLSMVKDIMVATKTEKLRITAGLLEASANSPRG